MIVEVSLRILCYCVIGYNEKLCMALILRWNIWIHFLRIKNCSPKSYVPCCSFSDQQSQSIGKLKTDKSILSHGTCIYFLFQYCFKNKTIRIINTYLCLTHTHKILGKWCIIDWLQEYSSRTDSERKSWWKSTRINFIICLLI